MAGVALTADAVVVSSDDILPGDPFAAQLAAEGVPYIGTFAVRTGVESFVGRKMEAMGFKQIDRFFKHFAAVGADHHASSPSFTRMYSPQ